MKSARISLLLVFVAGSCLPTSDADVITDPADRPAILGEIDAAAQSDELVVAAGTYDNFENW